MNTDKIPEANSNGSEEVAPIQSNQIAETANIASHSESLTAGSSDTKANVKPQYEISQTPFIEDFVFGQLPSILNEATSLLLDKRERDLVLTSAIVVLGGCLPNVHGFYDGDEVFPNLYFFGIAPPASGKSRMKYARMLGQGVDQRIHEDSKQRMREYQEFLKKEEGIKGALLNEPTIKSLFLAGNTSSAAVITNLKDNGEVGIICETEADTMTYSLKQDWGGFSDLLRRSFHSEPYHFTRKGNQGKGVSVQIRMEAPRLSIALTGTPSQLIPLIHSQEDGLFSRFIYYAFEKAVVYKDVYQTKNGVNFQEYYESIADRVIEVYEALNNTKIKFAISNGQEKKLNDLLRVFHGRLTEFLSNDSQSFVHRMGLIGYKIGMILTILRVIENKTLNSTIECSDTDFDIVLSLMNTYIHHTATVYQLLPKKSNNKEQGENLVIYNSLPATFSRSEIMPKLDEWRISMRTLDYRLEQWVRKGLLEKLAQGHYKKID